MPEAPLVCDAKGSRVQGVWCEGKDGKKSEKYLEEEGEENVMRRRRGENTAKTYLKPLNRRAKSR
jgi:hypothetical protein